MEDAYIGEIRIFPYSDDKLLTDWLPCDGRELPVQQHQALFSIIRNQFGGIENRTFRLPDLRGCAVMGCAAGKETAGPKVGSITGEASVTLAESQIPSHDHGMTAALLAGSSSVLNNMSAVPADGSRLSRLHINITTSGSAQTARGYAPKGADPLVMLAPETVLPTGGGQAHENRQPFRSLRFFICTDGDYPVPSD